MLFLPSANWRFIIASSNYFKVVKYVTTCFRFRRVKVLETVFVHFNAQSQESACKIESQSSIETNTYVSYLVCASFLHGCSHDFIGKYLGQTEIRSHKKVDWKKIARFNGDLILNLMKEELSQVKNFKRGPVYSKWFNILKKGKSSAIPDLLHAG